MKSHTTIVLVFLLIAVSALALLRMNDQKLNAFEAPIAMLNAPLDGISSILINQPSHRIHLSSIELKDGKDPLVQVTLSKMAPQTSHAKEGDNIPLNDASKDEADNEEPLSDETKEPLNDTHKENTENPKIIEETIFVGNKSASAAFAQLAALSSYRSLGSQDDPEKLSEYELDDRESALQINLKDGSEKSWWIGRRLFGNQSVYIQDQKTKEIFLSKPRESMLHNLISQPDSFRETKLFGQINLSLVEFIEISWHGVSALYQKYVDEKIGETWIKAEKSSKGSNDRALLKSWYKAFKNTRIKDFLKDSTTKESVGLDDPLLSVRLLDDQKVALGLIAFSEQKTIEGSNADNQDKNLSTENAKPSYYAYSDQLRTILSFDEGQGEEDEGQKKKKSSYPIIELMNASKRLFGVEKTTK